MKKILTGILCFILPSFILSYVLRLLGHKLGKRLKIGFSFVLVNQIEAGNDVKIGHCNLFLNEKLILANNTIIGYLNILKGPFTLILKDKAALGNKNYMTRAKHGITYGKSHLILGELTKVTTGHHLDLTRSITFGDFSILAGIRSQMWTHGYYHAEKGKGRVRIDGDIKIGDNVYIGSGCIFNPGVSINNAIHIGGGSVISKDLDQSGMYVSQGLRHIKRTYEEVKDSLEQIKDKNLVEQVYSKSTNVE
ncbi:acyltransferase [Winogradskyella sediminis]|uniref:acyltransferase n=1 Tax=Winogradskyella sediminis TaxID=1382466 RepID=UPI003AA8A829